MSSNDAQDIRFIEVSQITITDTQPKRGGGDYRVVIKHERGTEETIPSSGSGAEVTIYCKTTFVQLNAKTSIHIHKAKQFESVASGSLDTIEEERKDYAVTLSGKPGMAVILKLGEKMTMTQVAEARVLDANKVLEKESKSAEELDRVTGHVKILVNVVAVAAAFDPFPYAEAAVSIARLGLEKMERIPNEYKALKDVALDCIDLVRLDEDVRKVFKSDRVRNQLNSVMTLVIQALEFIFHYYSQSRINRSKVTTPAESTINEVKGLASKLEKQKQQIDRAFAIENREVLQKLVDQEHPLERDGNEQRIPRLMLEKEGWVFIDNANEADLLKRFLGTIGGVSKGKDPCLPGTRVSILQKLSSWAQNDSPEASRLFWIYGIAGCGKSAVAASILPILADAKRLAGSFFCRRDEVGRRNPVQLFGHIASRLAEKNPTFKKALLESLEDYRLLDNNVPSTFVEYVLKKPLFKAKTSAPSIPVTFLIDAIDECDDSGSVAGFLAEIVAMTPWFKLIVTSRELSQIKTPFVDSSIPRAEYDLFVGDPDAQSRDTRKYLLERLNRDLHHYVDELARKADGLFIWLRTVTEAIINSRAGRERKIQAFLDQPLFGDAEKDMAVTYLTVLEQASGTSETDRNVVRMITGLLLVTSSNTPLTISGLYAFLPPSSAKDLSLKEFSDLVMELKPVLKLTPVSDEETTEPQYRFVVQTHHASFLDFCARQAIPYKTAGAEATLLNPFWTDSITLHRDMAMSCFEIMKKGRRLVKRDKEPLGLRFNICHLSTSHKLNSEVHDLQERIATEIPPHLLYSSLYWASHVLKSSLDGSTPAYKTNLQKMLAEFLETTCSLFWLEVLSLTGNLAAGRESLVNIAMQTESKALIPFSQDTTDMCQFVEQCFPAMASTPHLYLSLTWLPVESRLWTAWKTEFSSASILENPIQQLSQRLSSTTFPLRVDTFAVAPGRKHIASGSRDGYVRLWNLGSTDEHVKDRQVSAPDAAPIDALAYTPDGSQILCTCNGFIYKLDAETLLAIGEGSAIPHDNICCMAVSHTYIAFGKENGHVVTAILDAKPYHEVLSQIPYGPTQAVDAIAFSPDGSRLVYTTSDAYVCVCDVPSGVFRHVNGALGSHGSFVSAVAFSLDGRNIATGDLYGKVRLHDAESYEELGGFFAKLPIRFLAFSNSTRIICALANKAHEDEEEHQSEDHSVSSEANWYDAMYRTHPWAENTGLQIWDIDITRRQRTQSVAHTDTITSVAFSPDAKKIVSGSQDCSVRVWDAQTGERENLEDMKHSDWVRFVIFSPDGKFIASGGDDYVIRIWDTQTSKPVQGFEGHTSWVYCGAYSPDGKTLVSGSRDGTLRIWDIEPEPNNRPRRLRRIFRAFKFKKPISGLKNSVIPGHGDSVTSIAFSPDGSCIASASDDSTIRLWDRKTWKPLGNPLSGHDYGVRSVAFSPEGTRLVSGGSDNTVRMWDVGTRSGVGEPLQGHTNAVDFVAYAPNGAFISSASGGGAVCCWDAATGNPVGYPLNEAHTGSICSLAVSSDGHRIVFGSDNEEIQVWDSRTFEWELDSEVDKSFISCGHRGPDKIPDRIPRDGWIRSPKGELLLWVPDEHRKAVCRLDVLSISMDVRNTPIHIMWDRLCQGEKWVDIREENSS